MKTLVFYKEGRDYTRPTTDFVETLERRYPGHPVSLLNAEERIHSVEANLYDITNFPAILVTTDSGAVNQMWQGMPLPLVDEVAGNFLK